MRFVGALFLALSLMAMAPTRVEAVWYPYAGCAGDGCTDFGYWLYGAVTCYTGYWTGCFR